jgi:hypothetical protein
MGGMMRSYMLQQRDTTQLLYAHALNRGQRATFWAALTGRSRCLLALEAVRQGCRVSSAGQGSPGAENRMVPIAQIVGSEGRCADFDRDFNPLHDRCRERWLRIAAARRRGMPLPPVDLVQVRDCYFVQDGHHRISVARALGQPDIEASVTVWQVSGPLPWEGQAGPSKQPGQKTLLGRLYHELLACVRTLQPDRGDGAARV